ERQRQYDADAHDHALVRQRVHRCAGRQPCSEGEQTECGGGECGTQHQRAEVGAQAAQAERRVSVARIQRAQDQFGHRGGGISRARRRAGAESYPCPQIPPI
ncbi:MAG: hypothetical protein ACK55I_37845, partial [bacterium]